MPLVKTISVTLNDGSTAVINASDFDPSLHHTSTPKKTPTKKKTGVKK